MDLVAIQQTLGHVWVVTIMQATHIEDAWITGQQRAAVETNRALAVVLAAHQTGDLIAWSQLSPALRSRDLSVTRTAEILGLAGLLNDDRVSSFDALKQSRLAVLPSPMTADVEHWLRIRGQGGPRSLPRDEHTVRMKVRCCSSTLFPAA